MAPVRRRTRPVVVPDAWVRARGDGQWTPLGTLDGAARARVDAAGLVQVDGAAWSLDWWIGAEDRWHVPAREAAVRQELVGNSPVVATLISRYSRPSFSISATGSPVAKSSSENPRPRRNAARRSPSSMLAARLGRAFLSTGAGGGGGSGLSTAAGRGDRSQGAAFGSARGCASAALSGFASAKPKSLKSARGILGVGFDAGVAGSNPSELSKPARDRSASASPLRAVTGSRLNGSSKAGKLRSSRARNLNAWNPPACGCSNGFGRSAGRTGALRFFLRLQRKKSSLSRLTGGRDTLFAAPGDAAARWLVREFAGCSPTEST